MSHDINSDPEVWELTDRFGERALRVWLEILSIADRYAGYVPGDNNYLSSTLGAKNKMKTRTIVAILDYCHSKQWLVYDPARRVRNHQKYNPSRDAKEIPSGKRKASPPFLSSPSLSSKNLSSPVGDVSAAGAADPPIESSNGLPNPKKVQAAWNEICGPALGKVVKLTNTRRRKIRVRCADLNELHKWEMLFRRIAASPFLRGEKGTWKASLDWLVENDTNWVKVMEGKYSESAR